MSARPDWNRREFLQTTALAASALPFMGTAAGSSSGILKSFPERLSLEGSIVSSQLRHLAAEKKAQAISAAQAAGKKLLPWYQSFFTAAENGDWRSVSQIIEDLRRPARPGQGNGAKPRRVGPVEYSAAREVLGAFEQFVAGEEKYSVAFGQQVMALIPPGSIYFGGTDPGRWVITALCKSHVNADPFFTLTQNALADSGYLHYLRSMYGTRIHLPTEADSTNAFSDYMNDALRRRKQNKLRPGEEIEENDGKLNVRGQVAVMAINGLLAKFIFDKNPDREFYVEESFPLDWMFPHLAPHGLILKINRQPLAELPEELVRSDHQYWTRYLQPMISDWLNDDTPVGEVAAFIEKVHVNHDLSGFQGDPRFVQNDRSQTLFSKLRSSIGGLYSWRAGTAEACTEKERMLKEADFAFRQAFALCPRSPEAVFRYTTLLAAAERFGDAIRVGEAALKVEPGNPLLPHCLVQLRKMERNDRRDELSVRRSVT